MMAQVGQGSCFTAVQLALQVGEGAARIGRWGRPCQHGQGLCGIVRPGRGHLRWRGEQRGREGRQGRSSLQPGLFKLLAA